MSSELLGTTIDLQNHHDGDPARPYPPITRREILFTFLGLGVMVSVGGGLGYLGRKYSYYTESTKHKDTLTEEINTLNRDIETLAVGPGLKGLIDSHDYFIGFGQELSVANQAEYLKRYTSLPNSPDSSISRSNHAPNFWGSFARLSIQAGADPEIEDNLRQLNDQLNQYVALFGRQGDQHARQTSIQEFTELHQDNYWPIDETKNLLLVRRQLELRRDIGQLYLAIQDNLSSLDPLRRAELESFTQSSINRWVEEIIPIAVQLHPGHQSAMINNARYANPFGNLSATRSNTPE